MLCDEVRSAFYFVDGQTRIGTERDSWTRADEANALASEVHQGKDDKRGRDKTVEIKKKSLKQVNQSKDQSQSNGTEEKLGKGEREVNSAMPPTKKEVLKEKQKWADLEKDIDDSDFEMPEEAVQCRTKKITKIKGDKRVRTVRRIFKMKDGTEEVHEDVIVEKI